MFNLKCVVQERSGLNTEPTLNHGAGVRALGILPRLTWVTQGVLAPLNQFFLRNIKKNKQVCP